MIDLPTYEILSAVEFTACPTCAAIHAVPSDVYELATKEATPIFCPRGHAYTPKIDWVQGEWKATKTAFELRSRLAGAMVKLEAANQRILELSPVGTPTLKELRRRSLLLASRAVEHEGTGRRVCPFCGKPKPVNFLAEHIRRSHHENLVGENLNAIA